MESRRSEILPRLDFSKLKFSEKPLATKEAIADIVPIEWGEDILSGKQRIVLTAPDCGQKE